MTKNRQPQNVTTPTGAIPAEQATRNASITLEQIRKDAKTYRRTHRVSQLAALDLVSQQNGYRDYHHARAEIGAGANAPVSPQEKSPIDLPVVPEAFLSPIMAEVHSDDWRRQARFDARTWFEQASDDDIRELYECGFGGDYPADYVAEFFEDRDARVGAVFDYIHTRNEDRASYEDAIGFECHVDEEAAVRWIKRNRPDLAASLKLENDLRGWSKDGTAIPATLGQADGSHYSSLDAAPWFANASDDAIRALVRDGLSGSKSAEEALRWLAVNDERLKWLVAADDHHAEIDPEAVWKWLTGHRPALAESMAAESSRGKRR